MRDQVLDWTSGEPRLVVSRCTRCGAYDYLPREHCAVCSGEDLLAVPADGAGLCVAVTLLHVTAEPGRGPVRLCLVELDEGPVVMGQVHDPHLAPGYRARVEFLPDDRTSAPVPSFTREA